MIDSLNAEIVLGNVRRISDALLWLKNTFFYVRLLANPMNYGHTSVRFATRDEVNAFLVELIQQCATDLDRAHMIRFDEQSGAFHSTQLGRTASNYYISHGTTTLFNEQQ